MPLQSWSGDVVRWGQDRSVEDLPPGARDFNERVSAPFLPIILPPNCDADDSSDDDDDNGIAAVLPGKCKKLNIFCNNWWLWKKTIGYNMLLVTPSDDVRTFS